MSSREAVARPRPDGKSPLFADTEICRRLPVKSKCNRALIDSFISVHWTWFIGDWKEKFSLHLHTVHSDQHKFSRNANLNVISRIFWMKISFITGQSSKLCKYFCLLGSSICENVEISRRFGVDGREILTLFQSVSGINLSRSCLFIRMHTNSCLFSHLFLCVQVQQQKKLLKFIPGIFPFFPLLDAGLYRAPACGPLVMDSKESKCIWVRWPQKKIHTQCK